MKQTYDNLIKAGHDKGSASTPPDVSIALEGIPHFLRQEYKVTMYHKGASRKGYIHLSP